MLYSICFFPIQRLFEHQLLVMQEESKLYSEHLHIPLIFLVIGRSYGLNANCPQQ